MRISGFIYLEQENNKKLINNNKNTVDHFIINYDKIK